MIRSLIEVVARVGSVDEEDEAQNTFVCRFFSCSKYLVKIATIGYTLWYTFTQILATTVYKKESYGFSYQDM